MSDAPGAAGRVPEVVEPREHDALEQPAERDAVLEHRRRHRRLAMRNAHAEDLADDGLERGRERRPSRHLVQAVADGPGRQQVSDQRVDVGPERRVRREQRMDPPTGPRHVHHPGVVQVRGRDTDGDDEALSGCRAPREQHAVDRVEQADQADRNVPDVHDAVVSEDRRVTARIREEAGVLRQELERGLCLDRPPQPFLEVDPDVPSQQGIELGNATRILHLATVLRVSPPGQPVEAPVWSRRCAGRSSPTRATSRRCFQGRAESRRPTSCQSVTR